MNPLNYGTFMSNAFTTKFRTGVVYDFSIVQKAAFYVVKRTYDGSTGEAIYNPSPILPNVLYVQINPSELKLNSGCRNLFERAGMVNDVQSKHFREFGNRESTLEISLNYDMYDEHMIGTLDGLIAPAAEDASLLSKKTLSLQRLVELSRSNNELVVFKWGPNEFFGFVENADFDYKAFSRFGFPLKASGKVTLRSEEGEWGGDGEFKSLNKIAELNYVMSQIKSQGKVDTGLLTTELAASKALR